MGDGVSVIIPTATHHSRRVSLMAAVDSVLSQRGVEVQVIVVANGGNLNYDVLSPLRRLKKVLVVEIQDANVSLARYQGLRQAQHRYVTFLDDDDILLPDGLAHRLDLIKLQHAAIAISDGVRADGRTVLPAELSSDRLLHAICTGTNWLPSCGGLFDQAAVPQTIFNTDIRYGEWTLFAFRIATARLPVALSSQVTFRLGESPDSTWNAWSQSHFIDILRVYDLIQAEVPANLRSAVNQMRIEVLHNASSHCLGHGNPLKAWRFHLNCLSAGGMKYLLFTRHLLKALY